MSKRSGRTTLDFFNPTTAGSAFDGEGSLTPTFYSGTNTVLAWTGNPQYLVTGSATPASLVMWGLRFPVIKSGTIGHLGWWTGSALATPVANPTQLTVNVADNGIAANALPGGVLTASGSTAGFSAVNPAYLRVNTATGGQIIIKYTGLAGSTFTGCTSQVATLLTTGDTIDQFINTITLYTDAGAVIGVLPDLGVAGRWQTASTSDSQVVTQCNGGSLAVVAGTFLRAAILSVATTPVTFNGNPGKLGFNQGLTATQAMQGRIAAAGATGTGMPDVLTPSSWNLTISAGNIGIPLLMVTT